MPGIEEVCVTCGRPAVVIVEVRTTDGERIWLWPSCGDPGRGCGPVGVPVPAILDEAA